MQTFFKGKYIKYFEVNLGMHRKNDLDTLIDSILEEANQREEDWRLTLNDIKETDIVTKTPWLIRTRWEKTFLGQEMKVLVKLTEKPESYEQDLMEVWKSVARIIEKCWKGVDNIADRGWDLILFWLNSVDSNKANSKPFRLEKKDNTINKSKIYKN